MSEIANGNGKRGVIFDARISLGSLLSIATLLLAIAGFALRYESRITTVEVATIELARKQDKMEIKIDDGDRDVRELQKTDTGMDLRIASVAGRLDNFRLKVETYICQVSPPNASASHDVRWRLSRQDRTSTNPHTMSQMCHFRTFASSALGCAERAP